MWTVADRHRGLGLAILKYSDTAASFDSLERHNAAADMVDEEL